MPSKARVLILSLDAADPNEVQELAAKGQMPHMARLLREAARVNTLASEGVFVSANWPTIFTSTHPDRHQYLCWDEISGGTYDYRQTTPEEVQGTPFWRELSDAGRRVGVMDVPHSVVEPLNGAMVAEWGTHDRHFGTSSWPPELAEELSNRHGAHPGTVEPAPFGNFAPCDYAHRAGSHRTDEESETFLRELLEGIEQKRGAALELLDRGEWDLFVNVMGESHCVGHQLWHLHDPSHLHYDPALAARLGGDPLVQVYKRLDEVIGDHLARLGPEDTAYVLLAHGMAAHHDGTHLLDHVLDRLDWGLDEPGGLGALTNAAAAASRVVPKPLRGEALRRLAPLLRRRTSTARPDGTPPLAQRRWFLTPNNTVVGAVRLNLSGREPNGRVHPGDRTRVLRWLSERLEELVNVDTGGRVVKRCVVTDDVYHRSPGDAFGDLFVEWERTAPIERVWSPAVGTVAVPYEHWRQGDHVRSGLLFAQGPGITPGERAGVSSVVNLGATFSAACGVELEDVDGRPIADVLPRGAAWLGRNDHRSIGQNDHRAISVRARAWVASLVRGSSKSRVPSWAHRRDPALDRRYADEEALRAQVSGLAPRVERLERHDSIATMAAWLRHAEVADHLLISVVLPTRDRRALLERAIASVQAQTYSNWELLVVDDGSGDDTAEFLERIEDSRIRVLRTEGLGVCAARNRALDAACGEVITYLDDDNRFDPDWLKAAALTFGSVPETKVAYGARVVDDEGRVVRADPDGRPGIHFASYNREAIRQDNLVDMGAIAHRRSEVRFDEGLSYYGDWDLLLKLCDGEDPVEIPAVAVHYSTDLATRMSTTMSAEEIDRQRRQVREKLPLRPS